MTYKMLVVDDEPANLRLLERLFRRDYHVLTAGSGAEALRLLQDHDVALLLTDQRMPGMTGIELLKRTAVMRPHMVRIVLTGYTDIEALVEAINCGHVYKYVTKPWNNEELRLTASRALEHYEANKSHHELTLANRRLSARLQEMTRGFVRTVADTLEAKDEYIHGHARRVSGYAAAMGRRMGLDEEALEQLSLAAFLHDIGKIGTPEHILLKPAPLTPEERAVMQMHAERGARMLAGIPEMQEIAEAVRHHHEHYDGSGYPEGLGGELIPLASRIILVADAYDAMTSPRPFREACNHETAIRIIERRSGEQFDPLVVRAFLELESLPLIRGRIAPDTWSNLLGDATFALADRQLSFDELQMQVETEPVLAACVLHEANVKYAAEPTAKLHEACARLGELRLSAMAARMGLHDHRSVETQEAWEHTVRTAEAARLLAEHTNIMDSAHAYTLGLLHDIGETLLTALFPAEMRAMREACMGEAGSEARVETEVAAFGVDHGQIGQWVLEACGVPRTLAATVQTHHDVMRTNTPAALLLHVADALAHTDEAFNFTALDALGSDRLAMLGLNRAALVEIHARTNARTESHLAALH